MCFKQRKSFLLFILILSFLFIPGCGDDSTTHITTDTSAGGGGLNTPAPSTTSLKVIVFTGSYPDSIIGNEKIPGINIKLRHADINSLDSENIQGIPLGLNSYVFNNLEPGTYMLTVSSMGYTPHWEYVDVRDGYNEVTVRLREDVLTVVKGLDTCYDIYFIDTDTGWITGAGGRVLKTTSGGSTWQTQNTGVENTLRGVQFIDTSTGWAVGDYGMILKSTGGGSTWQIQTGGTSATLYDVHFVNATTGWAVGVGGTILKTVSGGTTWQTQTGETSATLYGVYFTDISNGWATGMGGTILRTTDGGTTWISQTGGTPNSLNSVYFINNTTGWIAGAGGNVLKTTNSGEIGRAHV